MDYAYWGRRFPPAANDVRSQTFKYRYTEHGTKILVTDIVADTAEPAGITRPFGSGNHVAAPRMVPMTDGTGHKLDRTNRVAAAGGSVLFSDLSARWFDYSRWTQQFEGACFPPPDQW
jgi:hypothetical protein